MPYGLQLGLVAMWCFVVALAGGAVGLVLGNIRLPALLLVASSPAAGAGANIGISGVAAATAGIVHTRAGRGDWRLFAWLTPPSIVGLLARRMAEFVARPQTQERLAVFGFTAVGSTPGEFAAKIKSDIDRATEVVREAGIKVD